jgi:hypothetical protein
MMLMTSRVSRNLDLRRSLFHFCLEQLAQGFGILVRYLLRLNFPLSASTNSFAKPTASGSTLVLT